MPLQATRFVSAGEQSPRKRPRCLTAGPSRRRMLCARAARGRVVDEPVLVDALARRQIRGAALDVIVEEPLPAGAAPRPKRPASGACGLPGAAPVGVAALLAGGAAR